SDYYPFGAPMTVRTDGDTRHQFNGKEIDHEGIGSGSNSYDYGVRIYNPFLAKFLSVDPLSKEYPWYTPYQFAGNMPIVAVDLDGLEELIRTRYFDSLGNLYRTEIQVVTWANNSDSDPYGLGVTQIIHETVVNVDNNGLARASYFGTTIGNRIPSGASPNVGAAGGSSALNLQENTALFDIVPTGTADAFGNPISTQTSVSGAQQTVLNSSIITLPNGNTQVQVDARGRPRSYAKDSNNIIVINSGPAPANEPYLPEGFNVTPASAADRYLTPMQGGGPIPMQTPRSDDLPVSQFLLWISKRPGTTYEQPAGTSANVPTRAATQAANGNPKNVTMQNITVIFQ
ncbi:MAG TPA: hypothetical protein DCF33_21400, partial [Saprospirales bacterium]|nr:hypothetical protein [Saprospirales bacterium]